MSNYTFTLNMIPNTGTPVVVNLSQGDIGRELTFKLVEGSDPNITIATDASAITIKGTKPSGLGFTETCTATSDNTITVSTTEAMTQESGMIPAEVRFVAGTKDLGTANIIFAIEVSPHPEGTTDGTQETIQNLEGRLQTQIDDLEDRVTVLEETEDSGLTQEEKNLILTLFNKAAYAEDDAKTSYDALEALWRTVYRSITYNLTNCRSSSSVTSVENGNGYSTALSVMGGYSITTASVTMGGTDVTSQYYHSGSISIPRVTGDVVITAVATKALDSITATYTQSGTVYETASLDDLKSDLVVTANYSDGTSGTVTDYTLSGTLTEGTSVVTVSYGGKTATFSVTVTSGRRLPTGYTNKLYVQSNGDAYINTGIKEKGQASAGDVTTGFWGKFKAYNAGTNTKSLWGYQGIATGQVSTFRFLLQLATANTIAYYGAESGLSTVISGWDSSVVNEITVTLPTDSNYPTFDVNGTTSTGNKKKTTGNPTGDSEIYLMTQNYKAGGAEASDKAVDGSYIRCYGFKIFETSGTVFDGVPCERTSDGVAGIYDFISETFYPSIGANQFTSGNEV